MIENKHTIEDLKRLQSMTFEEKVGVTQARIIEWYIRNDKKCYVSFSGGKDSTVLAYIAAQVCTMFNCRLILWFSDTGLEFPELKKHVKSYGEFLMKEFDGLEVEIIIDYPKVTRGKDKGKRITFKGVIEKYGYPIISKEISHTIKCARSSLSKGVDGDRLRKIQGRAYKTDGTLSNYNCKKYEYLLCAPYKISADCCDIMKKRPSKRFEKETGLKPIIGTMTTESALRKNEWIHSGCNAFDNKRSISRPISFWSEQDILKFIVRYKLPYPSVYGEIKQNQAEKYFTTGYNRTGCVFCGYGCHLEKEPNRFQMLKVTHPKLWEYCMKPVDDGGLGMREVLEYIGVKVE